MIKIRMLQPHDALPEGAGKTLTVLRRLEEDTPGKTTVEIILSGRPGAHETTTPMHPDGTPMRLREAVHSARAVAQSEGIEVIHVIDRAAGPRERDILRHHGDHSVHMENLDDYDLEEGERGSDMRDRRG